MCEQTQRTEIKDMLINIDDFCRQGFKNWAHRVSKQELERGMFKNFIIILQPTPTPPHPFPSIRSFEIYGQRLIPVEYRWIIQKYFLIWLVTTKIDLIMAGYLPTYTIHHTWWRQCLLSLTSNIINRIRCYVKEVLIKVYWAGFRQMHNKRGIFEDY